MRSWLVARPSLLNTPELRVRILFTPPMMRSDNSILGAWFALGPDSSTWSSRLMPRYPPRLVPGNFPTVTRVLLSKIPRVDSKMSYVYDNTTTFHYVVDAGITYLCMSSEMVKRRIPFAFLDDIRLRFKQQVIGMCPRL